MYDKEIVEITYRYSYTFAFSRPICEDLYIFVYKKMCNSKVIDFLASIHSSPVMAPAPITLIKPLILCYKIHEIKNIKKFLLLIFYLR